MVDYQGEPDYAHDRRDRLGILVANLGTPDSPSPADVRKFLAQFLWDPRVVETPRWLWWLALHGVILRIRPAKSAHAYRQIWTPAGSPLLIHSEAIVTALRAASGSLHEAVIALGMTYGRPSIPSALRKLREQGARRLLVLPLFPQYSGTTTAAVFEQVTRELSAWRWIPEVRFVMSYHDEAEYVRAIADSVREHWQAHEKTHVLFSFHGVPRRYLLAGDPYHCQCQKTARLVAETLQLAKDEWSVSFQSQVGREEWLKPYTDQLLSDYARQGPKRVTVVCPGFATDCLETLEEIAIRNRTAFLEQGGESFDYVPALNASRGQIQLLAEIIRRHTDRWDGTAEAPDLAARKARAVALGAAH